MKIYNYYPTEDDLNKLSPSDKQIAKAYDHISEHRSYKDFRFSLPITIFFNCIQTMYSRLRFEEKTSLVISRLWDELKIVTGRPFYSMDNPNVPEMTYYPRRVFERTILFGGLYAKIKAEPFSYSDYMLDAIREKVCSDTKQREYFYDFVNFAVYHREETLSCESKQLLEALMKYKEGVKSLFVKPYKDYSGSELGNNDNKPNKYDDYEEYNQRFVAGRSKKVTEAKLETQKEEGQRQTEGEVSFTVKEIYDTTLERYDDSKTFADNLEVILFDMLHRKRVNDADVLHDVQEKMGILKKRLHPNPSVSIEHNYAPITNNSDGGKSYNMDGANAEDMRKLIDGKRRR